MKLGHIEIFALDVPRSVDFYTKVLECEVTVEQNEGKTVWLKSGEAEILLRAWDIQTPTPQRYGDRGPAIVFYTSDHEGFLKRIADAGIEIAGSDGEHCPLLLDPDGNWIQVVDPEHQ